MVVLSVYNLSLSPVKKAAASILLLIYFIVSTGFTVNLHYCMDKLHSWEVGAADNDNCEKCGMNTSKSSGCCRDEVKTVKLQQDLSPAGSIAYDFELPALVFNTSDFFILHYKTTDPLKEYRSHSPPLFTFSDTYLLNCVFRI